MAVGERAIRLNYPLRNGLIISDVIDLSYFAPSRSQRLNETAKSRDNDAVTRVLHGYFHPKFFVIQSVVMADRTV